MNENDTPAADEEYEDYPLWDSETREYRMERISKQEADARRLNRRKVAGMWMKPGDPDTVFEEINKMIAKHEAALADEDETR